MNGTSVNCESRLPAVVKKIMTEERKRIYHGFVVPKKVYIGEKSVNIQIPNKRAMDLVGALLKAFMTGETVDLTMFIERKDKRITITTLKTK